MLGQSAVAFHLSNGGASHDLTGELIPRRLHDSRHSNNAATLARVKRRMGAQRALRLAPAVDKLVAAINSLRLDAVGYDEIVALLGGEQPEVERGERAPSAASHMAGSPGDPANLHSVK